MLFSERAFAKVIVKGGGRKLQHVERLSQVLSPLPPPRPWWPCVRHTVTVSLSECATAATLTRVGPHATPVMLSEGLTLALLFSPSLALRVVGQQRARRWPERRFLHRSLRSSASPAPAVFLTIPAPSALLRPPLRALPSRALVSPGGQLARRAAAACRPHPPAHIAL